MKNLIILTLALFMTFVSQAAINQKVVSQVPESQAQAVIDAHRSQGYVPAFIDGFQHSTQVANNPGSKQTYFNFVFKKVNHVSIFQVVLASSIITYPSGEQLDFLESYLNSQGERRFAMVIKKPRNFPKFDTYHGPSANFQAEFNAQKDAGYHLKNRSVVTYNGTKYTTALFERQNVGSWISKPNQTEAQATTLMLNNRNAGRTLVHMDVISGSTTRYNVIFHQKPTNAGWYASTNLTRSQLNTAIANAENTGYRTTIICGYDVPGLVNGNEVMKIRYAATFVKPDRPAQNLPIRQ
ncbi:MAG: hypothetical protein AAGJ93_10215 [Bacteroidota bacterium]